MTSPLRILMALDSFIPDTQGGAEQMVHGWSRELAARGNEVWVLAGRTGSSAGLDEEMDGYNARRWSSTRRTFLDGYFSAIQACRRTARRLNAEWTPDIVHCHQGLSAYALLRSGIKAPLVSTFHSPWRDEFNEDAQSREAGFSPIVRPFYRAAAGLKSAWVHQMENKVLSGSEGIAVLSAFSSGCIASAHGISSNQITILPGAIDLERFKPLSEDARESLRRRMGFSGFTILCVRRLVRRMGIDILLQSMVQLSSRVPNLHLVLVGRGSERESLEKMAFDLGVGKNVTFAGFVSDKNLPDYYRAADLYILPTRALEGFGLSTVEALASGLPVVGTPVGATPEILMPLEKGLVARDASPHAITRAALPWITFPSALQGMRVQCRIYAEKNFRWSDSTIALEKFYRDILQKSGESLSIVEGNRQ